MTAIAEVVAGWTGDPPVTVAVTGWDQGGCPDIAVLLEQRFPPRTHLVASFDAFEWEGDSLSAGALLARDVARAAGQRRNWLRRTFQPVSVEISSPETRRRRKVLAGVLSAAVAGGVVALPDVRGSIVSLAGKGGVVGELAAQATRSPLVAIALLAAVFWLVAVRAWNATTALARFASSVRDEAAKGTFRDVRGQLAKLVRQALRGRRGHRFVVVVRNINRCDSDFALKLCEVAGKILKTEGMVLVVLGDLGPMERAAARKSGYPEDAVGARRWGRRHVRALIPNVVALPRATSDEVWRRTR